MNQINTPRYNIDTCAMLVEFNASVWTARKLDKSTTDEVVQNKNAAAKDAARVNKHLLAGRTELDVIQQAVTRARQFVYDNTLPWSDAGLRLLPTTNFQKFAERMNAFDDEFEALVKSFVAIYPSLITAQAMALGDMFRRDDYPTANEIMTKFAFRLVMPNPPFSDLSQQKTCTLVVSRIEPEHPGKYLFCFPDPTEPPQAEAVTMQTAEERSIIYVPPRKETLKISAERELADLSHN